MVYSVPQVARAGPHLTSLARTWRESDSTVAQPRPARTVGVPNVVHVLLLELLPRHDLGELGLEETDRVLHRQARALEIEPVLLPALVAELVVLLDALVQPAHAQRHRLIGDLRVEAGRVGGGGERWVVMVRCSVMVWCSVVRRGVVCCSAAV